MSILPIKSLLTIFANTIKTEKQKSQLIKILHTSDIINIIFCIRMRIGNDISARLRT